MCKIIDKIDLKTFTGYKVALKINDKLYSPATMVEYKVGEVPKPKVDRVDLPTSDFGFSDTLLIDMFRDNFYGKTAVYKDKWVLLNFIVS